MAAVTLNAITLTATSLGVSRTRQLVLAAGTHRCVTAAARVACRGWHAVTSVAAPACEARWLATSRRPAIERGFSSGARRVAAPPPYTAHGSRSSLRMSISMRHGAEHAPPSHHSPPPTAGRGPRLAAAFSSAATAATPSGEHATAAVVTDVQPHPQADRLSICTVELPSPSPSPSEAAANGLPPRMLSIICGAPNVATGQTVAVVPVGGRYYNAAKGKVVKLKKSKLRGVVSEGMILSEQELGMTTGDSDGILVLDAALTPSGSMIPVMVPTDEGDGRDVPRSASSSAMK